jgi:hypothetical protein
MLVLRGIKRSMHCKCYRFSVAADFCVFAVGTRGGGKASPKWDLSGLGPGSQQLAEDALNFNYTKTQGLQVKLLIRAMAPRWRGLVLGGVIH